MKQLIFSLSCILSSFIIKGQELFPITAPASTMPPKGVLAVRAFDESYKEVNSYRNTFGLKLMYGVTPKLSVLVAASMSNHHSKYLPSDLTTHTHTGNEISINTQEIKRGVSYPYRYNGMYLYTQYRFLSKDGRNEHFRMAAYAEGSYLQVASHEAEPNLLDMTSGAGAGFIATYLKKHFATSFTGGFIIPTPYKGLTQDPINKLSLPTRIDYGKALVYNLSFGYLLLPLHYKNYEQTNLNLYVELIGKAYEGAKVTANEISQTYNVPIATPLLRGGNYVDIYPGLQCIIRSNLRLDLSVGLPLINKSYVHFYPLVQFGLQRYFYFNRKKA